MTKEFNLDDFKAEILGGVASTIADAEAAKIAKALADKANADKAAAEKADAKATAKEAAQTLIKELETKLNEKDGVFAEAVKAQKEEIVSLKEEIAQVIASRNKPFSASAVGVKAAFSSEDEAKDIDSVVMLGVIKNKGMFETSYGKSHMATKAVNPSSSILVSSDAYETVFSTNLLRDIQAKLVIAPLFNEVLMTSANLTMPINPDRQYAEWVAAGAYGTDASTGSELTVTLTERTLTTFKIAAKSYLTEETDEDAILALLPILRSHLVEAHANTLDRDFLIGDGTAKPKGLVTQANAAGASETTTATATGSVLVTAKMIITARRQLGLYGINQSELALVVSQDAYWDLILDTEWADVQQVGMVANKLNGEVGNIYGMPVIVSNHFPAKALSAAYAVLVNKTNFVTTRQRGLTMRSDFDVEKDRRVFVATQRVNLEPMIEASPGNGKGVVEITYAAA